MPTLTRDGRPDARYVVIDGAGHGITLQKPGEINRLLLEHPARA